MDYRNITDKSPAEDQIIASSPQKKLRLENDPAYALFVQGRDDACGDPDLFVEFAIELIMRAEAKTQKLALYSSDRLSEAQDFVLGDLDYDYLHSTPIGYYLRKLDPFGEKEWGWLGKEAAYMLWNMASVKLIDQTRSKEIYVIGNKNNKVSALWTLEVHCLKNNPYPEHFKLYDGVVTQWKDRRWLESAGNENLLDWLVLLDAHVSRPECTYPPKIMKEHPLGEKGDSALLPETLGRLRNVYIKTMKEALPDFINVQQSQHEAHLIFDP
jgi:hypothetical protein